MHWGFQESGFIGGVDEDRTFDIAWSSPAVDQAAPSGLSHDRSNRLRDDSPDIGAYEAARFQVDVLPLAESAVQVRWERTAGIIAYQLVVSCPVNALPPSEVACDAPLLMTSGQDDVYEFLLTGLSNHAEYQITLQALDGVQTVVTSATQTVIPTDIFVYLPVAVR